MAKINMEELKSKQDGLDVIYDIEKMIKENKEASEEQLLLMKWYGLYVQKKASKEELDSYMLRVKIPGGRLNPAQLEALYDISRLYSQDTGDITTRQCVQFHHIETKDILKVFERLASVGMHSQMACGDCPRNIVASPLAGYDGSELEDVTDIVQEVENFFHNNKDFSNLPRKYKMSIDACPFDTINTEIQDLSFKAIEKEGEIYYHIRVGGGLGSCKNISKGLGLVKKEHILPATIAITTIYRDHGNREKRLLSRLGHLVNDWGVDKFREETEKLLDFKIIKSEEPSYVPYNKRHYFGKHASKLQGYDYIGCSVVGGRLKSSGLKAILDAMNAHEAKHLSFTTGQDVVILGVPSDKSDALVSDLQKSDIKPEPSSFRGKSLTCTGMEFCKLAVSETKQKHKDLVAYLEDRFPNFEETISINLSGCPNSCSHPHLSNLGFIGCKVKDEDGVHTGFEFIAGGNLNGDDSSFAQKTGVRVKSDDLQFFIGDLIEEYQKVQSEYTNFDEYLHKTTLAKA